MEQLKSFWGSSSGNKAAVVVSSLLIVCGCCAICGALSSVLPKNAPDSIPAQIAPTNPRSTSTPPILLPSATTVQITAAPAVVPTDIPSATMLPTATNIPPTEAPVVVPTEAPPAAVITFIDLTSPISAGQFATLHIQTTPGTTCHLYYTTPSGNESDADGLGQTIADGSGVCSWTWKIGSQTNPGTGRLRVTVNGTSQTFDIVIQ